MCRMAQMFERRKLNRNVPGMENAMESINSHRFIDADDGNDEDDLC